MITFQRIGTKVRVKIGIYIPTVGTRWYSFDYETNNEEYAGMLVTAMEEAFREKTEKIRKLEYESGYKDGRGRKKKRAYFWQVFEDKGYDNK